MAMQSEKLHFYTSSREKISLAKEKGCVRRVQTYKQYAYFSVLAESNTMSVKNGKIRKTVKEKKNIFRRILREIAAFPTM